MIEYPKAEIIRLKKINKGRYHNFIAKGFNK